MAGLVTFLICRLFTKQNWLQVDLKKQVFLPATVHYFKGTEFDVLAI
jgi:hypothetical protein